MADEGKPAEKKKGGLKVPENKKNKEPVNWSEVTFNEEECKEVKIRGDADDSESEELKAFLDSELPKVLGQYEWLCNREDDATTPFNSKYTARDKLIEVRAALCGLIGCDTTVPPPPTAEFPKGSSRGNNALAIVDYKIGANFIATEEYHPGQMYIDHALQHFDTHVDTFPLETLDTFNQLGILWSNREDFPKATDYLEKAERFHHAIRQGEATKQEFLESMTEQERALHAAALSNQREEGFAARLEELYTLNLFFLAQVYGHAGKADKSAEYCQMCLQRQLEKNEVLNHVDFAYNCMGLYNYYILVANMQQAEYCLHAAQAVLKSADPTPRTKQFHEQEGGIKQATADLKKTWGRFFASVLSLGWDHLGGDKQGKPYDAKELVVKYSTLPNFTLHASTVPRTFDEALKVFKLAEYNLDQAKAYYQLDGWVTEHLEILQEMATMYSVLANFETDIPRKCKILKRKINLFEPVINELNPRVYVDTIRSLSHDLAETYQQLADLKQEDNEGDQHVKKINELCFKAIRYLNLMFKTFQAPGGDDVDVPEAWMPLYVGGQLALARLHTKFIHYDVAQQVQEHEVALRTYESVVKFLETKAPSQFPMELKMCKEMCQLLPLKIQAIKQGKADLLKKAMGTNTGQ